MEQEKRDALRSKFYPYQKQRILVYGTGKVAERILDALYDFNIVGVIDRCRNYGMFKKVPVLAWENIKEDTGDVLIIASARKNYEEIFRRIQDKCIVANVVVLGSAAENLGLYFGNEIDRIDILKYCEKNIENLKEKIEHYEAISFNIFDTIIMWKTLEPWDIFDIVGQRVRKKGIQVCGFKEKRREAEQREGYGSIYEIYDVLEHTLPVSSIEKQMILQEEIQCEREFLIPRYEMVEAMRYAFDSGKIVNLISDTYMPEELLIQLLYDMGIKEFHNIYVSCDYKTGKEDRLFEIYLNDIPEKSCLHIGNDRYTDIEKPNTYGIDTYDIKSAFDLLRMSEMHMVSGYIHNINEKNLIGLLISESFNSPFSLYHTFGVLKFQKLKTIGKVFFGPLVVKYICELSDYLHIHKKYDKVLFAARDGYVFQKCYEQFREIVDEKNKLPSSIYFLTSRKLALRASLGSKDMIKVLKSYLDVNTPEELLKNFVGLEEIYTKKEEEESLEYIDRHEHSIINKSKNTSKNYLQYMKNCCITPSGKYLFCEMDSQGTTQYALDHVFEIPLDGFYLSRYYTKNNYNLPIKTIYDSEKFASVTNQIILQACFLETVLTSPYPSVTDMSEGGVPIFDKEERNLEEIYVINEIQQGIQEFFEEFIKMLYIPGKRIADEIPEITYRMFQKTIYEEECLSLERLSMYDNLLGNTYDIWTNKKRNSE